MTKPNKMFWVHSVYGYETRQPSVILTMPGGEMVQMSVEEARDLALNILEAAEAAEGDAFIFEFMQTRAKAPDAMAAQILDDFRKWRDNRRNSK